MRIAWSRIGRVGCHCHCYTCIETRHVQFRRISTIISRIRSGQTGQRVALDTTYQPFKPPIVEWKRRQHQSSSNNTPERAQDDGSRDEIVKQDGEDEPNGKVEQEREEELKEVAHDLQSLQINHWTIEDVVTYEPKPGGNRPPNIPTSITYDPAFMAPQSPWSADSLKQQNYGRVWSLKKIAKMETGIARLTTKICLLADIHSQWPSNLLALPEAVHPYVKMDRDMQKSLLYLLAERSNVLRNKFGLVEANAPPPPSEDLLPFMPQYQHYESGLHHDLLRDLHDSLVRLFDAFKDQRFDLKILLLKICHNLLVSAAPPNVQTMNILLLGFYSLDTGKHRIRWDVKAIIMDYLTELCLMVKIRPNEVTCATILATYRDRGLRDSFANFIQRMRAIVPEALMFTNNLLMTTENSPRLVPIPDNPRLFRQAVHPSPMIFSEIIKGLAKFCSLKEAIEICKDFMAKDWGYDWACLQYLLIMCVRERDWESGMWVWKQIQDFNALGHAVPIRVFAGMLALCVNCGEEVQFTEILAFAGSKLRNNSEVVLVDLATSILTKAINSMDDQQLSQYGNGTPLPRKDVRSLSQELDSHPRTKKAMFGKHDPEHVRKTFAEEDSRMDAISRVGGQKAFAEAIGMTVVEGAKNTLDEEDSLIGLESNSLMGLESDWLDKDWFGSGLIKRAEGGEDLEEEAEEGFDGDISGEESLDKGENFPTSPMDAEEDGLGFDGPSNPKSKGEA